MDELPSDKQLKNINNILLALVENWRKSPANSHYENATRTCIEATWKWDASNNHINVGAGKVWKSETYPNGGVAVLCDSLLDIGQEGGPSGEFNSKYQRFRYYKSRDSLVVKGKFGKRGYTVSIQFTERR